MTLPGRLRTLYGAGPLHLLALLASLAIAGAAVVGWFQRPRDVVNVLEWFAAAIVIHDLVLFPLYSLLDRIAFGGPRKRADRRRRTEPSSVANPTPYLRIPAILSGLVLAVFFPVILGLGERTELNASGIAESGYLARWLLATGVMFAVSGVVYAVTVARSGASRKSDDPDRDQATPDVDAALPPDQTLPSNDPAPALDQTPPSDVAAPAQDQTPPSDDAAHH